MENQRSEQWTRENLAWLAGLLEGEGCFLLYEKHTRTGTPYPCFGVNTNMSDGDVLQRAVAIAGVGTFGGPYPQKNPKHKPFWRWHVRKRDEVYALCAAIYPWMGERRKERIREIFQNYRTSYQKGWRHGTRQGYNFRSCRCEACRAAHAEHHRKLRKRRRTSE